MSVTELQESFHRLVTFERTGSLATLSNQGWPYVSMAPFAIDPASAQFIIHISELAAHTRYLLQRPQAAFMICASEHPGEPVHALPRVSFQVEAVDLERGTDVWKAARDCYLQRFPDVGFMVDFKDFHLFHLNIVRVRQVAGLGSAKTLAIADVHSWLKAAGSQ